MNFSAAFCLSFLLPIYCATIRNELSCGTKEDPDSSQEDSNSSKSTSLIRHLAYKILPDRIAPGFNKSIITWKISKYPAESVEVEALRAEVNAAANTAFQLWSSVCNLNFIQTASRTPDIILKFQRRKMHNRECGEDFETSEFAHYLRKSKNPRQIHINDDVEWTTTRSDNTDDSVNLVFLFAHEIGHVLGFAHNNFTDSIMFRHYYNYNSAAIVELSSDDIAAAVNRYGEKTVGQDCSFWGYRSCQTPSDCCQWNTSDYKRLDDCNDRKFCGCVAPGEACTREVRCCDGSICNGKCSLAKKLDYCRTLYTPNCQSGLTCTVDSVSMRIFPQFTQDYGRCL